MTTGSDLLVPYICNSCLIYLCIYTPDEIPLAKKRKNVNMNALVITNEDFSKKVQLLEEAKKKQAPKRKIINNGTKISCS